MDDTVNGRYGTREISYNERYGKWEIWYIKDMVHGRYGK